MTQAPTPGPLSSDASHIYRETSDASGRLAPTAPVEASGSELGFTARHDLGCAQNAIPPQACDCSIRIFKAPPVDARLNQACQSMLDDYQTSDEHHPDHILVRRADFELMASALRPQPSGETRPTDEEIRSAIKATEYKYFGDYEFTEDQHAAVDVLVRAGQALLSARPLALGGQHSGGVTADSLTHSVTDETMRALLSCKDVGSGRAHLAAIINALSTTPARAEAQPYGLYAACQAVLDDYQTSDAHHPDHVLIRRTDFERIKALVEAPVVVQGAWNLVRQAHEILRSGNPPFSAREVNARGKLRDALNPDRARAEAQDEGAAGSDAVSHHAKTDADPVVSMLRDVAERLERPEPDLLGARVGVQAVRLAVSSRLLAHPSPTPAADEDRVRSALTDLVSWFDKPVQGERGMVWVIRAGDQGADEAVAEALSALKAEGK